MELLVAENRNNEKKLKREQRAIFVPGYCCNNEKKLKR